MDWSRARVDPAALPGRTSGLALTLKDGEGKTDDSAYDSRVGAGHHYPRAQCSATMSAIPSLGTRWTRTAGKDARNVGP
jgi:hypothetical protein